MNKVVASFETHFFESALRSSSATGTSVSCQFVTDNMIKEHASRTKEIVEDLVDRNITCKVCLLVLPLQETTTWVPSEMVVLGYMCFGSEAGSTALFLSASRCDAQKS